MVAMGIVRMTEVSADAGPLVLIAEDDTASRDLYRMVLVREGMRIVDTASGRAVVDLARQHRPCVILLDGRLPDLAGEGVVRALKADDGLCDIPVVAATGIVDRSIEDWRAAGFDDVLFKPIRLEALIKTVRRYANAAEQPTANGTNPQSPDHAPKCGGVTTLVGN